MGVNLEALKKDYHDDKVVPFIGAGLSAPFCIPTWGELIKELAKKHSVGKKEFIQEVVDFHLEKRDYWGAIKDLKKFALLVEDDIQDEIVNLIKTRQVKLTDDSLHNYSDLSNMNFRLHLTTNYENLLDNYLKCENRPILLKDIEFNTQNLFDEKRVCHLHGFTSNPGTIVISEEAYQLLYEDKKYDNILKLITGNKKILFMGFSFDDQFIRRLINDHKDYFRSTHYILLEDPTDDKVIQLRSDYGLLTIPYTRQGTSHAEEIRKILNYISVPSVKETEPQTGTTVQNVKPIIGAGLTDIQQNVEENVFYKKLMLEEIETGTLELARLFYIAAEKYIRLLKKSGMDIQVIDAIFYRVYLKYKECYVQTFQKFGDSHEFVNVVHKSLEEIDFGRYADYFKGNVTDEYENRGLIHLLADESDEVWWGEKRFEA